MVAALHSARSIRPLQLLKWANDLPHDPPLHRGERPWRMITAARRLAVAAFAAVLVASETGGAWGQDMEPRAYSAVPIDVNFLIASYLRTTGSVSLDASLPITNVRATIDSGVLAY